MRFWLIALLGLAGALLAGPGLLAAGQLPEHPLTLDDCLGLARRYSPSLVIAHQDTVAAQANLGRAASAYYPTATLIATQGRTGGASFVETPAGTIAFSTSGRRRESEVALTQSIWETGRRETICAARHSLEASSAREHAALQDLLLSVSRLYYQALASEQLVEVGEATLTLARKHADLVKARVAVGESPRVDVAQAETDLADAEFALLQAENNAAMARARLKNEIGVPTTYDLRLASPSASLPEEPLPGLPEAVQMALKSRPEMRAFRHSVGASEQNLRFARATQGAVVGLQAQYERGITGPKQGESWSAVLSASAPLFDSGSRRAAVSSAQAALASLQAQEQQLVNAVGLEVESALLDVATARKSIQAAERAVASAQQQLSAAEVKYREGVGIFLEILDAQKALTRARTNHVQAVYNHQTALVTLRRATGQLLSSGTEVGP